jgi:hypothetical protein
VTSFAHRTAWKQLHDVTEVCEQRAGTTIDEPLHRLIEVLDLLLEVSLWLLATVTLSIEQDINELVIKLVDSVLCPVSHDTRVTIYKLIDDVTSVNSEFERGSFIFVLNFHHVEFWVLRSILSLHVDAYLVV